jgi:hypothetical protein
MTCGSARFFRRAPQTMPVFGTIHLLASKSTARGQSLLGQNIRPLKPLESALMDLLLIKIFKLSGMNTYRKPRGGGSRGVNTEIRRTDGRIRPSVLAAPDGWSDQYYYLRLRVNVARDRRASSMARCSALPYSMQLRRRSSMAPRAALTREGIRVRSISRTAES